ncbi:hypothetical protein [Achromobacter sp. AGC39]
MTTEFHPPAASACGKKNAFHHRCAKVGHSRAYAACLWILDRAAARELNSNYSTCSAAISDRGCPALSMRQEEELKGQAIYFTPSHVVATGAPAAPRPAPQAPTASRPASPPKKAAGPGLAVVGTIADAINNYVAAGAASIASPLAECAKRFEGVDLPRAFTNFPRPGESPLEFARRLASAKPQLEQ